MLRITDSIAIEDSELEESFVRASGPGGQNVNKVSSAVQLRFDARGSPSLPNDVAVRLMRLERLDERTLGELLMHFMLETILAAHLLGIDAFDQPAVEEGKVLAKKYLLGV